MNLKKKASEIKRQQEATGGGPMMIKNLSKVELRALSLLGQTFFAGCGVKEQGVSNSGILFFVSIFYFNSILFNKQHLLPA